MSSTKMNRRSQRAAVATAAVGVAATAALLAPGATVGFAAAPASLRTVAASTQGLAM
eukprot:CAMPEP_0115117802 /NCGR_PEP_ID=MMETSP0227-20121206/44115_1 /TAXON_ID=89957 /ORGANISM="Polarella glacialis, Strain CCMP 1383" /LENGTH=56 /DNA_ID=CAMNT_0002518955 /DNA_START=74 /DNA_END=241 /DNA_ORIENTATION=+